VITLSRGSASNPGKVVRSDPLSFESLAKYLLSYNKLHHGKLTAAEYRVADKKARDVDKLGPWFCLAEFKNDRRARNEVVSVGAIGFDVEGIGITAAELRKRLGGLEFVAVSSYAHLVEENFQRWRVIVRLSAPITDMRHFDAVHAAIAQQIGAPSTDQAKDPSRLWFLPGCPPDMVDKREAFYQEGEPFKPSTVPLTEQPKQPIAQIANASDVSGAALEVKTRLAKIKLPGKGHRDKWVTAGMGAHHHTGGADEGFQVWHAWSEQQPEYAGEDDCRTRWNSFGKPRNGEPVTIDSLRAMRTEQYTADELDFEVVPGAEKQAAEEAQAAIEKAKKEEVKLLRASDTETPNVWTDNYIVKGWLWQGIDAQIFGLTNVGKTFLSLHLGVHIAAGAPWFEQRTKQGGVLYLPYEGIRAIPRRLAALKVKYPDLPWATLPFAWLPMNSPLVDDRSMDQNELPGRRRLQAAIKAFTKEYGAPPAVIIVDTYTRAIGGSASDEALAGKFAAMARALSDSYGSTMVRIHHPGHTNTERARGSYAISAGLDVDIRVSEGLIEAPKQRDAEKNRLGFKLEVVKLGKDQDGDSITSCAVVPGPIMNELDLTPLQQAVMKVIQSLRHTAAGDGGTVARASVLDEVKKAGIVPEGKAGTDKLNACLMRLEKKECITLDRQEITLLERGAAGIFDEEGAED
jgi:hypothetical protein